MRLIQLAHKDYGRRVAKVEDPHLILLDAEYPTSYDLFSAIIGNNHTAEEFISDKLSGKRLDYDTVYENSAPWRILPCFDHPEHPMFCMLSGTGLTHKASAENRQEMHRQAEEGDDISDSMEIYLWGEEGGKPNPGNPGIQPEWFYKGNGTALKGMNEPLEIPPYADDGGEEPEIAGIYMVSPEGSPYRIGFAMANEFSDHVMEKKNYLYLAPSKLRTCAIGPELVVRTNFPNNVSGRVSITRNNREFWSQEIKSGELNMAHSVENLEHHHFKYKQHRMPGMVHIHFFGADAFSFGDNIQLQDGDWMNISFEGFGRPLKNPVSVNGGEEDLLKVQKFA